MEGEAEEGHYENIHANFVIITHEAITQEQIRKAWTIALTKAGLYKADASRVFFKPVPNCKDDHERITKYTSSYTKNKYHSPLFKPDRKLRISGQTIGFHETGKTAAYHEHARHTAAIIQAQGDPYILDHPTINHYLDQVDKQQAARKVKAKPEPNKTTRLPVPEQLKTFGELYRKELDKPIEIEALAPQQTRLRPEAEDPYELDNYLQTLNKAEAKAAKPIEKQVDSPAHPPHCPPKAIGTTQRAERGPKARPPIIAVEGRRGAGIGARGLVKTKFRYKYGEPTTISYT